MAVNWRVYGKETVAARLNRSELPGFFRKRITVGPHEAAIVIRNGRPEEPITEQRYKVAGVFDRLARLFGGGGDTDVVFIDLAPVDFSIFLGATTTEQSATVQVSHEADTSEGVIIPPAARFIGWVTDPGTTEASAASQFKRTDVSEVCVQAISLDREIIPAECLIRVSVDLGELEPFIGLMHGKGALATWDIAALVRDEIIAKVLVPQIAAHRSDELRGNRALLAQLEADCHSQLQRTFTACGIALDSFTVNWGLTQQEIDEIQRKRGEREEVARQFQHQRQLAEMQRHLEIEQTRLANLQQIKVAAEQGDQELTSLALAGELNRDAMVSEGRLDLAKIDAQIQAVQLDVQQRQAEAKLQQERSQQMLRLEVQRKEEMDRLDAQDREFKQQQQARLARIDAEDKEMAGMVRMQIEMATSKHERETAKRRQEAEAEFRRRQQEIDAAIQDRQLKLQESTTRMDMIRSILGEGLKAGAADAGVLTEFLKQATEQEYATTSDAKVQARAEAQAGERKLDAYKDAEDRERTHQRDMTGLSAQMMDAAKQPAPGAPPLQPRQPGVAGAQPGLACPGCNAPIQANWKACPQCGRELATTCPKCNAAVQPDWKACPQCGQQLG